MGSGRDVYLGGGTGRCGLAREASLENGLGQRGEARDGSLENRTVGGRMARWSAAGLPGRRLLLLLALAAPLAALAAAPLAGQTEDRQGRSGSVLAATAPPLVAGPDLSFPVGVSGGPITIDGRLDDDAWAGATVIPIGFEVRPAENTPARVATECRIARDQDNLYLGCTAQDPEPNAIRAYVVDRDGIDGHDRVVLTLDPFNDQRRAFQFGISALGVQSDAILAQQGAGNPNQGPMGQPIDPSWDAIWRSAGAITGDGFIVEAAIPFRSLRFPNAGDGTWGAYLTRWWPRSANVEMRSTPWDRGDSCVLCQAHLLTGIQGARPGANVQLTPTLTGTRADVRPDFPTGPMVAGASEGDIGVDAQWGVTSDLTLNLTANPDFSQVEADVAQLDVNNRFALFFPEKRPFFLEGADFFGTPIQAVFTRSIREPTAGAKITGKLGGQAVGVLVAQDRTNHVIIPGSQFSRSADLDGQVTTAVARFRRDFGETGTVGALVTGREGTGYHNRVGGLDAFYRPMPALTLQAQAMRSDTEYPATVSRDLDQPLGAFTGTAARGSLRWNSRDWSANADLRYTDPDFRADAGFVTQSGITGGNAMLSRVFWGGADQWFNQIRLIGGTWRNTDFDGNRINGGGWMGIEYQGPRQTFVGLWPNFAMTEYFDGVSYTGLNQLYIDLRSAPTGALSLGVNALLGDGVDYTNGGAGAEVRISPEATLRIGRNVEVQASHTFQRLSRDGAPVFTANLSQLRTVYNFSTRSFVRAIVQYQRTERDTERFAATVDRASRSLFAQFLYAYKVDPQTVLFLGYGQDGAGLTDQARHRVPLTTRGRTFFVKLGYAWRP